MQQHNMQTQHFPLHVNSTCTSKTGARAASPMTCTMVHVAKVGILGIRFSFCNDTA